MDGRQLPSTSPDRAPQPIGTDELAALLGMSIKAVRRRLRDNGWPHLRGGEQGLGPIRFLPEHVDAIRRMETVTTTHGP